MTQSGQSRFYSLETLLDSDRLNRWLTLGANFGVVVGLVILIFEIDQNTEMTRVQMLDSRLQSEADRRQSAISSDITEIRAKLIEANLWPVTDESVKELSVYEQMILSDWFAIQLATIGNSFYQCQQGYLDPEACDVVLGQINNQFFVSLKSLGRDFRRNRASFIDEVRRVSDEIGGPKIGEDGRFQ